MTDRDQDFEIEQGDDVVIEDTVSEDGVLDISGFDAQVTVAEYEGATNTVIQYDHSDSRFSITDGPNGTLQAELDSSDTESLRGDYYYEIELTDGSGETHTVTTGEITVHPSY